MFTIRFSSKLAQTTSDNLGLANTEAIYEEARIAWKSNLSNPVVPPPLDDKKKLDIHFAEVDKICKSQPKTTHE